MENSEIVQLPDDAFLLEYTHSALALVGQVVFDNQADLTKAILRSLRKDVFANHIELHPRDIVNLAELETASILTFLRGSFSCARQHGGELCQAGLSVKTVFNLYRTQRLFFMELMQNNITVQNITSSYRMQVLEGFMEAREKVIFSEQENIRTAYEIALNRSNTKIQEVQALVQKATEASYRNIILAQEDERRRISSELHDGAGQVMVGIRMSLENLYAQMAAVPAIQPEMKKTIELTEGAMQQIRSLAYSLRPPVLDLLGINLAIKQMCVEMAEKTSLNIRYLGKETPALSSELSISIYRIVQEALTNIIKHAAAKNVWIRLQTAKDVIKLAIEDDGCGFAVETIQSGIGLDSMRERSRLLNGQMVIESQLGKFSKLKFLFPIMNNK